MSSDEVLLHQARRFDRLVLAKIYDEFSPRLYRYAYRLLGDTQLAEDCVAETFTRFLQALKRHRGPRDHIQAYLFRIAHNWIVDYYRQRKNVGEQDEGYIDNEQATEDSADRRITNAYLRSILRRLTRDQQQVILLKFFEDLSNETIAELLGKPIGAVKSLQHRALRRLQQILEEDEEYL